MFNKDYAHVNDFITAAVTAIKDQVGDRKAVCAFSGGVDSVVAALLVHRAIGHRLTCLYVDSGLMRLNESDEIEAVYGKQFDLQLIRINAQTYFLEKLAGITEPEEKRKIVGEAFVRVFEAEAKKLDQIDCLVQGTIYPDIVESGTAQSALIKSHHNVGGLPDAISFTTLVEPLRALYKDQVRQVGLALGMPEAMVYRQPFPGPGLAVRCIGEVTQEKMDVLRQADFIVRDELAKAGLSRIWQHFAILTGVRSVGIKNDQRIYGHAIAIRAVDSSDAMTAQWSKIPFDVLAKMADRIVAEVVDVSRVVYDITAKPPGTIEWE